MNDFENTLKQALNDRVTERVGPRRNPPALDVVRSAPRRSGGATGSRWLIPLMTAAAVAAVAMGTTVAFNAASDTNPVAPATPGPVQTDPPAPVQTATPAPVQTAKPTSSSAPATSTTTPTATSTATTRATQRPVVVELGGASVSLPVGWVARDYALYVEKGSGAFGSAQRWCLSPSELPASTKPGACPLTFSTIDPNANGGLVVDVDADGGWASNPPGCGDGIYPTGSSFSEATGDRPFGGRTADWRRWTFTCDDGAKHLIEQYVVASGPGFTLYSDRADARVHDAMTKITTNSTLPPRTSALRFMDRGYIRSIDRTSAGVHVLLDRAVKTPHDIVNENPATYRYVIPTATFDQARVVVGSLATLFTDGSDVQHVYVSSTTTVR